MFKKSFAIFAATLLLISSFLTLSNVKADTISPAVTQEESVTDLFSKGQIARNNLNEFNDVN
ncbi:hypothetical protein [Lactiplantibacillus plantarum]|uniref:hypothetical protein n=1 Tax=Lactiplantibacillus plantarum TaxID=1590 RepID=UPI00265E3EBC|nr:hypothetical protein [Lactiplantibacillus plantarum]MDO1601865.1 hypothetical protein [Lactiplantibacillus plantarum]